MHRVDLVRARALHDIHELVEVAVVGEVERRIGAKQPRELRILGPTRNQRGAVASETTPDLVLSDRRCDDDTSWGRGSAQFDPPRQPAAPPGLIACAPGAAPLPGKLDTLPRPREHHPFRL